MIPVGITGGIGSGKSYVARLLAQNYRVPIYDSDSRARSLMLQPELRRQIEALVGLEAYNQDGSLNRAVVASYLFAAPEHVAAIDGIVHPAVKADFTKWAGSQSAPIVLLESAILVEAQFLDVVDSVIVVEAPLNLRLERAMQRDQVSREKVLARMRHQLTDDDRRAYASVVVVNDGRPIMPQLRFFMAEKLAQSQGKA